MKITLGSKWLEGDSDKHQAVERQYKLQNGSKVKVNIICLVMDSPTVKALENLVVCLLKIGGFWSHWFFQM